MYAEIKSNFLSNSHDENYFLNLGTLDNAGGSSSIGETFGS